MYFVGLVIYGMAYVIQKTRMSYLTRGQLAERAGVGAETIRYCERRGLLSQPERSSSGYRHFPPEVVEYMRENAAKAIWKEWAQESPEVEKQMDAIFAALGRSYK